MCLVLWKKRPHYYIYDLKVILMKLNVLYDDDMYLYAPYFPLVHDYREMTFSHVFNAIGRTTGAAREEAKKFIHMLMRKCWRDANETT